MLIPSFGLILTLTAILLALLCAIFLIRRRSARRSFPSITDPASPAAPVNPRRAPVLEARPAPPLRREPEAVLEVKPAMTGPKVETAAADIAPRPGLQVADAVLLNAAARPVTSPKSAPAVETLARIGAAHRQTASAPPARDRVFPKQACLQAFDILRERLSAEGQPAMQLNWRQLHWRDDDVYELSLNHLGSGRYLAVIRFFEAAPGSETREAYIEVSEAGAPKRRLALSEAGKAAELAARSVRSALEAL